MRRAARLAVLCAVPLMLATEAYAAGVVDEAKGLRHGRDVAAYQDYVSTYVGGNFRSAAPQEGREDRAWVQAHPDLVLVSGDRACAWLATQPMAPSVEPTRSWDGYFVLDSVVHRYAIRSDLGTGELSEAGRSTIAAGAWDSLCWRERERRTAWVGFSD